MLQVKNLVKQFQSGSGSVTATNDISFSVPDGQFASIVGRSGSGKTTLLALLGGLEKPTSGSIVVGDHDVADREVVEARGLALRSCCHVTFPGRRLQECAPSGASSHWRGKERTAPRSSAMRRLVGRHFLPLLFGGGRGDAAACRFLIEQGTNCRNRMWSCRHRA